MAPGHGIAAQQLLAPIAEIWELPPEEGDPTKGKGDVRGAGGRRELGPELVFGSQPQPPGSRRQRLRPFGVEEVGGGEILYGEGFVLGVHHHLSVCREQKTQKEAFRDTELLPHSSLPTQKASGEVGGCTRRRDDPKM